MGVDAAVSQRDFPGRSPGYISFSGRVAAQSEVELRLLDA